MSEFTQNKSVTNAKLIKHQHDWQINNHTYCASNTGELVSPSFTIPGYGEEQWHIELTYHPMNYPMENEDRALRLVLNAEPKKLLLDLKFSLMSSKASLPGILRQLEVLEKQNGPMSYIGDFTKFIIDHSDDTFTIRCDIILITGIENMLLMNDVVKFEMPESNFSDDLEQLYNDSTTADVTLTIQNTTIHAHKAILMARSPVFAAMFRNNMKESITNNVDIENLDPEIVKETLRFIYTDRVTDLKNKAVQLLDAADKYDLQKLKVMCEESISENIGVENAAEMLVLVDRHRAHQLKTQLYHFMKSHMADVVNTEGYRNLEHYHPRLTLEAFKAIISL